VHPKFGPVWATGHLGADVVTLISTPSDEKKNAKYKEFNWKVVQEVKHVPGQPVRQDPSKSKNLWADAPQNPDKELAESVAVWDMADLSKPKKIITSPRTLACLRPKATRRACTRSTAARMVPRYGSPCGAAKTDQSAIVVYDEDTRE